MALKTFNPTGSSANWSDATAWGGTAPASGSDYVAIAAGKTCIFDIASFTLYGGGITINSGSVLECPDDSTTHTLTLAGDITGAGTIRAGSTSTPYSIASTVVIVGGSYRLDQSGGLVVDFHCAEPTSRYVEIDAAASGDTTVTTSTDLTAAGDVGHWALGRSLVIADNTTSMDVQCLGTNPRTISASVAPSWNSGTGKTTITLSGTLDSALVAGARVVLVWRNIEFQVSGTQVALYGGSSHKDVSASCYKLSVRQTASMQGQGGGYLKNMVFDGVMSGFLYGFQNVRDSSLSGVIAGFSNCRFMDGVIVTATGLMVGATGSNLFYGSNGCVSYGTLFQVSGLGTCRLATGSLTKSCPWVFSGGNGFVDPGATVTNCSYAFDSGCSVVISGSCHILNNTRDVYQASGASTNRVKLIGRGARLQSSTQVNTWKRADIGTAQYDVGVFLYDVANSSDVPQIGQVKCWIPGGTVVSAPAYSGYPGPQAYTHIVTCQDDLAPAFCDFPLSVVAGEPIHVHWWAYLVGSNWGVRPKLQVIDPNYGFDDASSVLASSQAAATYDAWQTLALDYTPAATRQLILRVCARGDGTTDRVAHVGFEVQAPDYPAQGDVIKDVAYDWGTKLGTFDEASRNTDPGQANVWYGTGYKIADVAKTGTKRASSITNCVASNVANGVTIDDVTGSLSGGGLSTQDAQRLHLLKAALANKRIQVVDTRVLQVLDDDGSTVLATITPSESDGIVTFAVTLGTQSTGNASTELQIAVNALAGNRQYDIDTHVSRIYDGETLLKTLTESEADGVVTVTPS